MNVDFAFLTVAEIICFSNYSDTTKHYHIFRQLKVVQKWVGLDRVQSIILILGRVGLGHLICGSGWVGSRKLDPRPTVYTSYILNVF